MPRAVQCALAFLLAGLAGAAQDAGPTQSGEVPRVLVHGRVTNSEGQPLPDVLVLVLDQPGLEVFTGDEGRFRFALEADRMHDLIFSSSGHFQVQRSVLLDDRDLELNLQMVEVPAVPGVVEVPVPGLARNPGGDPWLAEKLDMLPFESWLEGLMEELGEPSLKEAAREEAYEAYRLTFLRWRESLVAVRAELGATGWVVSATALSLEGPRGRLVATSQRDLSAERVTGLRQLVETVRLWEMPWAAYTAVDGRQVICRDGSMWMLEGVRAGRYHLVSRDCPPEGSGTHRLGALLVELSGEEFDRLGVPELHFPPEGRFVLTGRVRTPDGEPLAGALVALESPHMAGRIQRITGPDGTFEFYDVPRGSGRIAVTHEDHPAWEGPWLDDGANHVALEVEMARPRDESD